MPEGTPRVGVLLINVGTPDAPRTPEVRRYLREFLGDPRVLDVNKVARWLLLEGTILPFRSSRSAEAYRKIWTEEGSPLLLHEKALRDRLAEALGPRFVVSLGMRYGNPSIAAGLRDLASSAVEHVVIFPLYPQLASSSTGTSVEEALRVLSREWNVPSISTVPPFYDDPGFLGAFAALGAPVLEEMRADHVLVSFHGLPERHIRKSDPTGAHCLSSASCCDRIGEANRLCYRAQCFATARALATRLGLPDSGYDVSFQSRLGRDPWIRPFTDELVHSLPSEGVRRLAVFCPAFVADCLETLEEIGMDAREEFLEHGGEDLRLVPSLNSHPLWVSAAARLVRDAAPSYGLAATPRGASAVTGP
jgi:ferrochelatase